ncbi:PLP-dependent aminotransferase family protein [Xanthomonas sp. AM6]|uniref:aminotransferase-like domain-containing protein n=1 Tax=Xanthomonas sp. AM6 TaxID=2982531 RepID=UPI0021DAE184|nr:PLP-dependent aminotransferase family protein [Xanthomonas sp. AM6]UYB52166.1 PLP-dependent aminotransferase family protein [Xanthomonas sp. AM6]
MNAKPETLTARVVGDIRKRIDRCQLPPGARLPSIRGLAESLGVSKSTVVEAYDRLAAEGAILARPGSGFYVPQRKAVLSLAPGNPRADRDVDPLWVAHQSLSGQEGLLKPSCGWLPSDWMPQESIRRALRASAKLDDAELADYATPLGHPGLRQLLARRLADRAVEADADQILLVESGTHAVDLACRFLLEPGDTVLVDDPCYFNFHALLRAHRATVVGVPYTPNGPDVDAFEGAVLRHKPRLYLTNSALHNPTGATLSPATAHRVLKAAEQHGVTIIEDDIFAEFQSVPSARLAAFDGLQHVIQVGSFSKTLSASVRCGYIAARADWIDALTDLKIATAFGSGRLASELVYSMLRDGGYRRHVETLRQRLARAMPNVRRKLESVGITPWAEPGEGMYLWSRLPDGASAVKVARVALKHGVVLAPGSTFSLSEAGDAFFRFNVAQCSDRRVYEVLRRSLQESVA